ncbi:hypothetical protein M422DRAFT_38125 [Sphaerobolus stellatus SS14]|uniref:Pentatricopeptide repeat-containing protein n=1 Tax=Sphaerobolus stellatus (strain SS14) TaxID=990650 RepID=A0A0C9TBX7_SPHS4|nr:hypothetical protein M422DRAFT_38125 [Sphaerobolus stellatus SS14]
MSLGVWTIRPLQRASLFRHTIQAAWIHGKGEGDPPQAPPVLPVPEGPRPLLEGVNEHLETEQIVVQRGKSPAAPERTQKIAIVQGGKPPGQTRQSRQLTRQEKPAKSDNETTQSKSNLAWLPYFYTLDYFNPEEYVPNLRRRQFMHSYRIPESYLAMRRLQAQKHLTARHYIVIAKEARHLQFRQYMEWLAEDLLNHFPRDADTAGYIKAVIALLTYMGDECPISPMNILKLYNSVVVLGMAEQLPLPNLSWIAIYDAAILHPDACRFTLPSLLDACFAHQVSSKFTFALINLAHRILLELLLRANGDYKVVAETFQKMMKHEIIAGLDTKVVEPGSFKIIIARSLIRGYLTTGTFTKAIDLMKTILLDGRWGKGKDTTPEDLQMTGDLALEVLRTTLQRPTAIEEVKRCFNMLQLLIPASPKAELKATFSVDVPDDTVLLFYDACCRLGMHEEAATLFVHLSSKYIRDKHVYPAPHGHAMYWLFDYFADPGLSTPASGTQRYRGYLYMGRKILDHLVDFDVPVPIIDRPRILSIAARRGLAFHARKLYERWTDESDPDADLVRGSAHMLLPMVKLFLKRQAFYDNNVKAGTEERVQGISDGRAFATHMVDTFMESHKPLGSCSQVNLNGLARALLVLDRVPEAVAALHIVMRRFDIPDIKDINVLLLTIAQYSVEKAMEMVEYMIGRGVKPSASTFSALIHAALKGGEEYLVPRLVSRARELGFGVLTPKGIATLVQARFLSDAETGHIETTRTPQQVELVRTLIQSVMDYPSDLNRRFDHGKDHLLSVKMGEQYVRRAVELGEGRIAVEFWRILLRDRTPWTTGGSVSLRRGIAEAVTAQGRDGRLMEREVQALVRELGMRHVDGE